ncbi:hypothetical protein P389DRAFT_56872 [Cystobasidium minutum MCA 4210]|uniref:uncharacterized protein n=1 Tax=Cystobasidium minutum MCA 4210 TaxID=1397322 RepID=UPI0034CECCD8|eukprot:jgi/Rhomi1/56872/CE56871_129
MLLSCPQYYSWRINSVLFILKSERREGRSKRFRARLSLSSGGSRPERYAVADCSRSQAFIMTSTTNRSRTYSIGRSIERHPCRQAPTVVPRLETSDSNCGTDNARNLSQGTGSSRPSSSGSEGLGRRLDQRTDVSQSSSSRSRPERAEHNLHQRTEATQRSDSGAGPEQERTLGVPLAPVDSHQPQGQGTRCWGLFCKRSRTKCASPKVSRKKITKLPPTQAT